MNLEGKAVLVTGGTKGIGAATALEFAKNGADVAILGRYDDDEAKKVKAAIEKLDRTCVMIVADMGKPEDATRAVGETIKGLGGIDVIIHNAGGGFPAGILEVTPEEWYRAFDVHVHAAFFLCRAALPHMKKKGEGAIVMMSSVAGIQAGPGSITYGVVKGAIPQFTRSLARELGDFNIRVNCVAPGIIRTRFHEKMTPEAKKHNIDNRIPLHREGTAQDVAETVVFLAKNDFITGELVVIDGGMTMRIG
ncbi:MAG: SDR family oxidoreductase [Candidatus Latescibacteria bacterium]|nr:SDR family oxidoreductase [Candidatus Latescibacterota bacterium]